VKLLKFFGKKKKDAENTASEGEEIRAYSEEEFLASFAAFEKAYLRTVIIAAVIAAAGIGVAVIVRVSYGLICAIAAVLFYIGTVSNILYNKLGLAYTSVTGAIYITECYGKGRSEAWIPRRLMWIEVRSIEDEAFDHDSCRALETVHMPRTLVHIGKNVFLGCGNISRICFEGSREEWEAIECETDLSGIEIEFDSAVSYPEKVRSRDKKGEKKIKKDRKNKKGSEE